MKDARARAFQDAKDRAEQYAQLSGLTAGQGHLDFGGIRSHAAHRTSRATGGMPANVPLEPGQQTVSFSVTAVWELR